MGLRIRHVEDVEWTEVRAQTHGGDRRSVWNRFVEMTADRSVIYTRYDPGFVLPRHSHTNDEIILVVDGDLTIGDRHCPTGTVIVLDAGTMFGPLIAGERGTLIFEVFPGTTDRADADLSEWAQVLAERGITALPDPPFTLPVPPE